jgi:hypothetical protein
VFVHQIIKTWPDFHSVFDDTITKGIKAVGLYKKRRRRRKLSILVKLNDHLIIIFIHDTRRVFIRYPLSVLKKIN